MFQKRGLTLLLVSLLTPLGFGLAHAELTSSSPENGATVTVPPTEVTLSFSERVALDFGTFKVYPLPVEAVQAAPNVGASHGERQDAQEHGDAEHEAEQAEPRSVADRAAETLVAQVIGVEDDEDARVDTGARAENSTITLSLQGALPAGDYVVMWRAPSADGHLVEGFITFSYDPGE